MKKVIEIKDSIYDSNDLNEKIIVKANTKNMHLDPLSNEKEEIFVARSKDVILNQIAKDIEYLKANCQIGDFKLDTRFKYFKGPIIFIKRVIKRVMWWLFQGYIAQQNAINHRTVKILEEIEELHKHIL